MNPYNHSHGGTHGVIDPSILVTKRGTWAFKWSFVALMTTTIIQALVTFPEASHFHRIIPINSSFFLIQSLNY